MLIGITAQFCNVCKQLQIHEIHEANGLTAKLCKVCLAKHDNERMETEQE